ncbi:hypothetical protein DPMN_154745 [Dreissena polymorpha]|uniref:Uncharacterized protein n=1 Tax=Dreissena polymorpha TaxID=45954 RepID=A0A9D4FLP7_DREPO|nr:hypothetical protein DPMN_154745 [Dreissena polymorpha]
MPYPSIFLCLLGNNVKLATEGKGIEQVCNVLKIHMNSSVVVEAACASILALSLDVELSVSQYENIAVICDKDGVGLLISAISSHANNAKKLMVTPSSEESAYRVLTNEGPNNTHICGLHKDNADVVESVVTLLMELAEYGMCLLSACVIDTQMVVVAQVLIKIYNNLLQDIKKKFNMNKATLH